MTTRKATLHCEHDFPFWHYTDEDGLGGCKGAEVIELTRQYQNIAYERTTYSGGRIPLHGPTRWVSEWEDDPE